MCYINQTQQAQLGNMVSKAYMIQSCQLYIMGKAIVSQPQLPLPAVLIVRQQTLSPPKPSSLTPFSAVAPPRSVAVSNCRPQKTTILLETIYEEDNESECMETSQASSSAPFIAPPQSTCFLEVRKPLSAPYTHNCQCA